jgi:tetratricopeptide (TPR) repeat protein
MEPVQYLFRQADEERLRGAPSNQERLYGSEHLEVLGTLSELGDVLIAQGRYRSAEDIIRRLVNTHQNLNGGDDIRALGALEQLGRVLSYQGFYSKAKKIHRRTLESRSNSRRRALAVARRLLAKWDP